MQPQDLVITLLGAYVRPFGQTVWSGGLVLLLGEFGFSDGAARVALTRLVRRDLIERVREGRLVHYRVTPRARRMLEEGDGRIFSLGHPRDDGSTWTVLWHQIPEDRRLERGRLARRLRFLGFGSVQDSVWVAPHDHSVDVAQLLEDLGVSEFATAFLARAGGVAGLPALVARAWDLSDLAERYEAFADQFSPYVSPRDVSRGVEDPRPNESVRWDTAPGLDDREAFLIRTSLIHLFRGFPLLDPELPEELAPLSRPRGRAVEIFHSLYESLARPSRRYFAEVTAAPARAVAAVTDP